MNYLFKPSVSFRRESVAEENSTFSNKSTTSKSATPALACISHHPPAATAPWHAMTGFRSVGVLEVVSTTPACSLVAKASHDAPWNRLATNGAEKCELVLSGHIAGMVRNCLTAFMFIGLLAVFVPVQAQDFTTGLLIGTVVDANGEPVDDVTVTLTNDSIGYKATSTTDDADGIFRFPRLAIANYTASVDTGGQTISETIRVLAGTVQRLVFTVPTETVALEQIAVVAQRAFSTRNDPLSQEGGITVDTDDLVARVPLDRNITDVALLAPGASDGN